MALFTQEKINRDLQENDSTSSEFQSKVVHFVHACMKLSADRMSRLHASWDSNSYIYRGYRMPDKDDADAMKDGEPPKIIVPITYAQIQTALSFILATYGQRDNVYECRGLGPEDEKNTFALNTDLSYQLNDQKFTLKLYFWLLDALKQGFGVIQCEWDERYTDMRVARQETEFSIPGLIGGMFGKKMPTKTVESVESVLNYQGNKLTNISPYAFFPDPSVSIANFQQGAFVATEIETSKHVLESQEGEIYFGVDKIPLSMSKDLLEMRPRRVKGPFSEDETRKPPLTNQTDSTARILTTMQFTMSQKDASKKFDVNLGDDTKPIKWLVALGNDQKVIRFEPLTYLSGRYNYEVIEYSPDHDAFYNSGLADTIAELQNLTTFMLNSHVVNIRKVIANRFVVDPSKVMMDDIKNGSIYIRTQGSTADINRVIQQLQTSDITRSNVADMESLAGLIQVVTGISENALGQYTTGRRSATEARNVNAGSAARLKMHGSLTWLQGVEPLGKQILSNTRQWRTKEVFDQIVGEKALETPFEQVILANPDRIAGGYDFIPYDATLPTDRQYQAGMLQELFKILISNPNSMQLLNKNPMKLMNYIAELYNIRNLKDFDLQDLKAPQAQVLPDHQVQDIAGAGAESVDVGAEDILNQLK